MGPATAAPRALPGAGGRQPCLGADAREGAAHVGALGGLPCSQAPVVLQRYLLRGLCSRELLRDEREDAGSWKRYTGHFSLELPKKGLRALTLLFPVPVHMALAGQTNLLSLYGGE